MADSKVFDVAKPGTSEPQTGSKPMVVGHKNAKDNSVKETKAGKDANKKDKVSPTPKKKKKIEPLNKPTADTEETDAESVTIQSKVIDKTTTTVSTDDAKDKPATQEATPDSKPPAIDTFDSENADESDEPIDEAQKDATEMQLQRERHLQELIKNKQYNVTIKESSSLSLRMFVLTFVITACVAIIGVALLIDAEVLDLGIDLPFDIL